MATEASAPQPENADPTPPPLDSPRADQAAVEIVARWQGMGGTWQVVDHTAAGVTLSLRRCDGGEEAQRLTSADPELLAWVGSRTHSDDPAAPG